MVSSLELLKHNFVDSFVVVVIGLMGSTWSGNVWHRGDVFRVPEIETAEKQNAAGKQSSSCRATARQVIELFIVSFSVQY
jgi:hypothetical protein